jgi:hypothetical protein
MFQGDTTASGTFKTSSTESIVTGVSTITQFGMGTALIGIYVGYTPGWRHVKMPLLLLLGATALRAVFLSDRLSLIELVRPSAILAIRLAG